MQQEHREQNQNEYQETSNGSHARNNGSRTSLERAGSSRSGTNVEAERTVPEIVYGDYTLEYDENNAATSSKIPDVLLDVPVVKVDEIDSELNDLRAKINLFARVFDLVEISAGVDAHLGRVRLHIVGVEAQALLKVRLDNVTAIIDRVLTSVDRNPQIVEMLAESAGLAVEDVGSEVGSAIEDFGEGAGSAVESVGAGADGAAESVGEAAEQVGGGGYAPADSLLQPGRALVESVNEEGQTVRGSVDGTGDLLETTLDENGVVAAETISGNLLELPVEEEELDELGEDRHPGEGRVRKRLRVRARRKRKPGRGEVCNVDPLPGIKGGGEREGLV